MPVWRCPHCTWDNPDAYLACGMCGSARTVEDNASDGSVVTDGNAASEEERNDATAQHSFAGRVEKLRAFLTRLSEQLDYPLVLNADEENGVYAAFCYKELQVHVALPSSADHIACFSVRLPITDTTKKSKLADILQLAMEVNCRQTGAQGGCLGWDEQKEELVYCYTFQAQPPTCLLYTSPSPRDQRGSRMPSSA